MSERVVEPLEMSDATMFDFIACHCDSVRWLSNGWLVTIHTGRDFFAHEIGGAVRKAAAYYKDAYGDF